MPSELAAIIMVASCLARKGGAVPAEQKMAPEAIAVLKAWANQRA